MGGGSDLSSLSGAENCVLGITAGILTKLTNYPLLSWKNTVQQGLPISLNPKIVYRGLVMACLNLGGTTGVQFGTTGYFQKMLAGAGASPDQTQMGGAFLGGLVSGVPCSLWELTMIQQQRFGTTLLGTIPGVYTKYGIASVFRGVTMTLGRESLFTLAMLGITPKIQATLVEKSGIDKHSALAAGALAGSFFAATLTHPMDTIKTCMQGDLDRAKYTNVLGTGSKLASEYGVARGLFKGLAFRITLIATTFFLVNNFKQLLFPVLYPHAVSKDEKK
uniref:Mitochondrial carrier protein n=1 Tax=Cryptomonas curvata TaxID=233186 RepID=A0A7S0MZ61_9CRYP|mmetsp:Transcript_57141/g.119490  ORF Transcript_57141/g.119490 Transcript_57141/m.119490 type:complete len:277 (+) Transcript_57141:121-951(+)|eukprot:CAMPEP_0172179958 /NCGR_PEP_ID=MMETSP1050-20130122/16924_1 /TAXON_ID=233186 /ORGANISM="Cryptomonas curvata, Strain CCAP979/52" /LENGTH=276 /DNA_ID=CAMNT_0012852933 /DNA_START=121 /DNA_END=951 /DNA_ORIENTATION=+